MRHAGILAIIALALALAPLLPAQHVVSHTANSFRLAAAAPATCNPGDVYFNTATTTAYNCTTLNTWTAFGGGAPAIHAASHQDGGIDEVATVTPAAGAIPKAGGLGTLGVGWIPNLAAYQPFDVGLTALAGGSDFVNFIGPGATFATRSFTLPDIDATLLYSGGPLGTPLSGFATNLLGLPLTTGVIGILPGANGGTGSAFFSIAGPLVPRVYTFPNAATTMVGLATTQELTNKTLNDFSNYIHADATHTRVRNDTAGTLTKGTPVYITGYNAGLDVVTVGAAKADSDTTLPAIGLLEADLAKNVTGVSLAVGVMEDVKTNYAGWAVGDKLYISTATAGTLTKTRPTGGTNFVQRMGIVLRVHASLGVIEVIGAHRSNALPLTIDAGLLLSGTLPLARLDTPVGYWRSYTVAYTATEFEAADTDAAVNLFTLPANGVIEALRIKHSVAFAGTAVTSVACSVGDAAGDTADDDAYMPAFNVFQAVGNTVADFDGGAYSTTAAQQTVQLHCVCNVNFGDGAGTTALTAGSVTVSAKWAVLP